eukprot:CAMPEP_0176066320 /NCGR_PEP_ID=MMETSP0120_2-20121206/33095_1 /TAXON_ID=160619 /ORGANISM="Kryptoperidinium foliaceum, Strain CCMP 1326" /LENGTH=257 /DNA_ID=CAMNT_0017399923 /DNA_START=247 /DNA_END=1017 /DNA_ORIENTATION=-
MKSEPAIDPMTSSSPYGISSSDDDDEEESYFEEVIELSSADNDEYVGEDSEEEVVQEEEDDASNWNRTRQWKAAPPADSSPVHVSVVPTFPEKERNPVKKSQNPAAEQEQQEFEEFDEEEYVDEEDLVGEEEPSEGTYDDNSTPFEEATFDDTQYNDYKLPMNPFDDKQGPDDTNESSETNPLHLSADTPGTQPSPASGRECRANSGRPMPPPRRFSEQSIGMEDAFELQLADDNYTQMQRHMSAVTLDWGIQSSGS